MQFLLKRENFTKFHKILFIFLLFAISLFYNYQEIIFKDAYSMHQWRQADCLSLTMSYEKGASFFSPSIYFIGRNNDTHVISEFPIIYYTVGNIWKITGKKVWIFRLINVTIVFLGLYALFLLLYDLLKDVYWASIVPVFLLSSPVLAYYTNNFLADAPAFGFALIAWYFFYKYLKISKKLHLILSFFFFSLAALVKISSSISFVALLATIFTLNFFKLKTEYKINHKKLFLVLTVLFFVVVGGWYAYARYYNSKHLQGIFLQGIYPIWDLNNYNIRKIASNLYNELLPALLPNILMVPLFFGIILYLVNFQKANKLHYIFLAFLFTGVISFLILWYKAFTVHDYYLLNLIILFPFSASAILLYIKQNFNRLFLSKSIKVLVSIFAFFVIADSAVLIRLKYDADDHLATRSAFNILANKNDMKYWDYYHRNYNRTFKALEEIQPYLSKIGVKDNDTIISIPDYSINISLYLMDKKGFSDFGYGNLKNYKERIEYFKKHNAKYLIINDTSLIEKQPELKEFTNNCIGTFKNVKIYKLD